MRPQRRIVERDRAGTNPLRQLAAQITERVEGEMLGSRIVRDELAADGGLQARGELGSSNQGGSGRHRCRPSYCASRLGSRKKPNRYCATRRIWISSEPSVMR